MELSASKYYKRRKQEVAENDVLISAVKKTRVQCKRRCWYCGNDSYFFCLTCSTDNDEGDDLCIVHLPTADYPNCYFDHIAGKKRTKRHRNARNSMVATDGDGEVDD